MLRVPHRSQYRRDAQAAYQQKMLAAHAGRGEYPKIRNFNHAENSTNSVYMDIEAAERLWVLSAAGFISLDFWGWN